MRYNSIMLSILALILGIFSVPLIAVLPVALLLATLGLIYGVVNIILNYKKNELVPNILTILFSILVITGLLLSTSLIYN